MPGPWIIVTGGNRGLGLEIARKLAESGKHVVLTARDITKGKGVASILGKQIGAPERVQALQLDVDHTESLENFIAHINSNYNQQIQALINNAAVFPSGWNEKIFEDTKRTNFDGPTELCKGVSAAIVEGGKIVNVTSSLGRLANLGKSYRQQIATAKSLEDLSGIAYNAEGPGSSSHSPCYDLTKAMLNKATNLMSKMPEFQHLTVNAGDPGWCRTDMGGSSASRSPLQGRDSILAVLDLPGSETGGVYFDGQPADI